MEQIKLIYLFGADEDKREINFSQTSDDMGLNGSEICEMFFDFMQAVGFSKENVLKYFRE